MAVRTIGRRVSAFHRVAEKLGEVGANAELATRKHPLNINLRSPRPFTVAGSLYGGLATTKASAGSSAFVLLNDAKVSATAHYGLHASFGDDSFDYDVKVDKTPRLKLRDAHVREFSPDHATETLHGHREQSARVGIEICRTVETVGVGVERSTNYFVACFVDLTATTLSDEGLAALSGFHYALMSGAEDLRTWRGERDECERDGRVLRTLESRLKHGDGIAAIDVRAVRTLVCQSAAAGLRVCEV